MSAPAVITGNKLYQQVLEGLKLTDQQLVFVVEYVSNGFNCMKAFDVAGYTCVNPKHKSSRASQIRYNKEVAKAIEKYLNHCFKTGREVFRYKILNELNNNAFYDVTDILNLDGSPVHDNILDYTPEQRRRIESITPKRYGRDGSVEVAEIKLTDRAQAIKDIIRMYELTGGGGNSGASIDVNVKSGGDGPVINVNIAAPTDLQKQFEVDGTTTFLEDDDDGK